MKSIWKFKLAIAGEQVIKVPYHLRYLHVAMQGEDLCLWAEVTVPDYEERQDATILVLGTGHEISSCVWKHYIGTAHDTAKGLVWHVFEGA